MQAGTCSAWRVYTVGGRPIAHFLVEDGAAAQRILDRAGIPVAAVRAVVTRRLRQETPGQLGAIMRAIAAAGARIEVVYSDHDHRLILLTSDQGATDIATREWDR